MDRLLRRPTPYILILLLIFLTFLSLNLYTHNKRGAHSSDSVQSANHIMRDYVLNDDTILKLTSTLKKLSARTNIINIYKPTLGANRIIHTPKVQLRTLNSKTPIFVYSSRVDNMISAHLKSYGTWEEDLLNQTGLYLQNNPNTTLIDIGCNIGVYTLFAANLGHQVISLDPVENNLILLSKSVDAGDFADNVTLILNAVSDEYKSVTIDIPKDNVGGAHIVENVKNNTDGRLIKAETILLNDLIPNVRTENVFIKMDVEGHEWNVLKGGQQFFQTKNVKVILMEWVHHRHNDKGRLMVEHLTKHGFLPYKDISKSDILDPDTSYTWPENVFWIKR